MNRARSVRVSFRRKHSRNPTASKIGAIEVYTSVRVKGKRHPQRKHICYVSMGCLDGQKSKIQNAVRRLADKLGWGDAVSVDWENAKRKWPPNSEAKPCELVDRETGVAQIHAWCTSEHGLPIPAFSDAPFSNSCSREGFVAGFLRMHDRFLPRLRGEDPARVATWFEEWEAPRLVLRFYDFVKRKAARAIDQATKTPSFDRAQFLEYLSHRTSSFVVIDYVRWSTARAR